MPVRVPGAALIMLLAGPVAADELSRGRDLYNNYCQSCHGGEATGLAQFTGDIEAFRQRLAGTDNMPDMSEALTAEEATDLFAYIASRRPQ